MKVGKNNKLLQKILMVTLTALILFNFIMPTVVKATEDEEEIGGGLFTPIQFLLVGLGDSIMKLMQIALTGSNSVTTTVSPNDSEGVWWISQSELDWQDDVEWDIINNEKVQVPTIEISPESIFSGKIPAFDINFFSPSEDKLYENGHWEYGEGEIIYKRIETDGRIVDYEGVKKPDEILEEYGWTKNKDGEYKHKNGSYKKIKANSGRYEEIYNWKDDEGKEYTLKMYINNEVVFSPGGLGIAGGAMGTKMYYTYQFGEKKWVTDSEGAKTSIAGELRNTISYWYNILRNIAIIGLLSVLVYIGIRIVLSSAAADKSKYKEMLKDWVVAICLLFFMHYFMNFTVTIIDSVSDALVPKGEMIEAENGVLMETHTEETTGIIYAGDKLIGDARIKLQTGDASQRMAYTIIYIVLIIYTFIFAIMYLKRVLYMAFFTMMSPLVALTYPLDKMRDGRAQAFDMWIKEYTFNALIQPFHLIIYYVLVSSAIELATENPLYALVAIGFMMPAEKLLRKFFGFGKSETAGALGGAVGGAMLMQGINYLSKKGRSSSGKKGGSGSGTEEKKTNSTVRTADSGKNMNELLDGMSGEGGNNTVSNPSNSIPTGDSNYSAQQERLDELTAEGFGEGDEEYDKAKAELDKYKLNTEPEEDTAQEGSINIVDEPFDDNDTDEPFNDSNINNGNTNGSNKNEEKTHRLRAAASIGGRWLLKGGVGVAKLAARGVAAGTLGTIGIAAGLASDNYSNVLAFGAAGLKAGNAVAGAGINRVSKLPSDAYRVKKSYENLRGEYEQKAYSATERKRRANERADDAFMRDKEAIKLYKDKFGEKGYRQAMEDAKQYRAYGITDNATIIKAMTLETKGLPTDRTDNRRILLAGQAPQLGRKDIDKYGENLRKRGFSEKQAEIMQRAVRLFNDIE